MASPEKSPSLALFAAAFLLADALWLLMGVYAGQWEQITTSKALGLLFLLNLISITSGYIFLTLRARKKRPAPPDYTRIIPQEDGIPALTLPQVWDSLPPTVVRNLQGEETLENRSFRELRVSSGGTLLLPDFLRMSEQLGGVYWEVDQRDSREIFELLRYPVPGGWGTLFLPARERMEQEAALRESQAFLQTTIGQSPLGLVILDAQTREVRICNDGAKEILGIPLNRDMTGRPLQDPGQPWEILDLSRNPVPPASDPFLRVFSAARSDADQVIIRRSDGRERYVVLTSSPIYDQNGIFFAAFLALLDASELHKTEQQLQELNRELELRVQQRTQELVQTQKQLMEAERLAGLGALVAGVAHEINTPVGVSVTAASYQEEATRNLLALYSAGTMKKSDLEQYLLSAGESSRIILENLGRASHLIRNFKMISVDQSSDMKRKFRLKQYISDVIESLPPPDRRISVSLVIRGEEGLELNSYPGAYSQILTNLYMNSCIHGFEAQGYGTVTLEFHTEDGQLLLTYSDDGGGMDEQTLTRIFEPFFTTRRNSGGTGLGMNIVFNLVSGKLGGRVTAQSAPGRGTTFHFTLPLILPDSHPQGAGLN